MTPWAELLRAEDRRTRERAVLLRYPLWAIKLELAYEPLDLNFDTAGRYGLAPDDLVSDEWSACQAFAEGEREGAEEAAFVVPSAALAGTRNLVLLGPAVVTAYEAEPVGPEDLPTSMATQDGRCPEGLWDLVHFKGAETPHPAYEAWVDGKDFEFQEPLVTPGTLTV